MVRKIILFGKNGQVGWELQRSLAPLGQILALGRQDKGGDLANLTEVKRVIDEYRPDIIVNASAYTAVDKAETEQALARQINTEAVAFLAQQAKRLDSWFIHYSTDYIFDGSGQKAWQEEDQANPLNVYGHTKLDGEKAIQEIGGNYLVIRTSWVYGAYGYNFIKTVLRLALEKESLRMINDQVGAPTGAELIADITAQLIERLEPRLKGIYHLSASGETSWYEFARMIVDYVTQLIDYPLTLKYLEPIATNDYPTSAKRPLNSRLCTQKLRHGFNLELPHWQRGVERVLSELLSPKNR